MTEKDVQDRFCKFLISEKKFPTTSLLRQAPTYSVGGSNIQADLLLMDVRIGEYIGIVEFKGSISPQLKGSAAHLIQRYLSIIKAPELPSYLVYPFDESDFQILVFGENEWISITKDEFPEFETLSTKKKIEEKVAEKEVQEKIVEAVEMKQDRTKRLSVWILVSLIVGILASIIASILSGAGGPGHPAFPKSCDCAKVDSLARDIAFVQQTLARFSLSADSLRTLDTSATYLDLERRVTAMESLFSAASDRALALEGVNTEISILRAQSQGQEKVLDVRQANMVDRITQLNNLVLGLIFALFTAAIGFVATAYGVSRKSSNRESR